MYRIEMRRYSRMLAVVLAVAALPAVAAANPRGVAVTAAPTPSAGQSADDTPWPIAPGQH